MKTNSRRAGPGSLLLFAALAAFVLPAGPATAQDSTEDRIATIEEQIETLRRAIAELAAQAPDERVAELERQIEVLAEEIEKLNLGSAADSGAAPEEGLNGRGLASAKVYRVQ